MKGRLIFSLFRWVHHACAPGCQSSVKEKDLPCALRVRRDSNYPETIDVFCAHCISFMNLKPEMKQE